MIHAIWHNPVIPDEFDPFLKSWVTHNPETEVKIWSFKKGRELIEAHYPFLLSTFDSSAANVQKANILRYVVLHRFGGIYLDLDMLCLKPLTQFFKDELFFARHSGNTICNAICGSKAEHPFWELVFSSLLETPTELQGPSRFPVIQSTGSPLIQNLIESYDSKVKLYPPKFFFPVGMGSPKAAYKKYYPEAYTMHFWNWGWGHGKVDGGNLKIMNRSDFGV